LVESRPCRVVQQQLSRQLRAQPLKRTSSAAVRSAPVVRERTRSASRRRFAAAPMRSDRIASSLTPAPSTTSSPSSTPSSPSSCRSSSSAACTGGVSVIACRRRFVGIPISVVPVSHLTRIASRRDSISPASTSSACASVGRSCATEGKTTAGAERPIGRSRRLRRWAARWCRVAAVGRMGLSRDSSFGRHQWDPCLRSDGPKCRVDGLAAARVDPPPVGAVTNVRQLDLKCLDAAVVTWPRDGVQSEDIAVAVGLCPCPHRPVQVGVGAVREDAMAGWAALVAVLGAPVDRRARDPSCRAHGHRRTSSARHRSGRGSRCRDENCRDRRREDEERPGSTHARQPTETGAPSPSFDPLSHLSDLHAGGRAEARSTPA
jgi:hypothetical protein